MKNQPTHKRNIVKTITQSSLDTYFQDLYHQKEFSGAVLITNNNTIVLNAAYGYADYENNIKNSTNTRFRIASITKQIIAAAIMQLQKDGLLFVHDTLSSFMPDYPSGDIITLHHLLTHSSGIVNYTTLDAYWDTATIQASPNQTIERIKHQPLLFKPGSQAQYSNSGYVLLSYIIEQITGMSLIQFLTSTFFTPLGMHNTGFASLSNSGPDYAKGFKKEQNNFVPAINVDMMQQSGAGFLYSTTTDLLRWHQTLQTQSILTPELLKIITKNYFTEKNWQVGIGYGVFISSFAGYTAIHHPGAIKGFMSSLFRFPETNSCIILLSNTEQFDRNNIAQYIAQTYF